MSPTMTRLPPSRTSRRPSLTVAAVAISLTVACSAVRPEPEIIQAGEPVARLDYESAVARITARQAAESSVVVRGLGSILMTHGQRTPRVYVLLHGFTDVPTQFQLVGEHLFATGDNVYIPRLPHHGERVGPVRALGRVQALELAAFGDSSFDVARALGDSVIVVGLSAGGAITGAIAQAREVRRAVLIAPAIAPGRMADEDEQRVLLAITSRLPEYRRQSAPPDTANPEYVQGISSRGLSEVLGLGRRVRSDAARRPPATKEIVFLLNERDATVSEAAAIDLAERWFDHGANVTIYRFPWSANLPHNVMETNARGGNVDITFPVIEALARGIDPPKTVSVERLECSGWRCAAKRALKPAGSS
jgi:alpha-beta hydrolase superfamily lysophospholipase